MANVKIVYASLTGNTEMLANLISEKLNLQKIKNEVIDVDSAELEDILKSDAIVIATYTYGQGEMPDEFLDFFDELSRAPLSDKKYAVAGSGDRGYGDLFCAAAESFDQMLEKRGAKRVSDLIKIEFSPETNEDVASVEKFTQDIANSL